MMDDLVTWLRAQLDEDERAAWSAAPGPWVYQDVDSVGGGRVCDPTVAIAELHYEQPGEVDPRIRRTVISEEADGTGAHIARHDPARALAEVEAKRRILELHQRVDARDDWLGRDARNGDWPANPACYGCHADFQEEYYEPNANNCEIARLLALPYADQPGYREEWRP